MLTYNKENDFKINILPTVGGEPIDFSSAEDIIVTLIDPANISSALNFILIVNGINVEIVKNKTLIPGEYFVKIQYRVPDETYSDQYQDKSIGLKAFKIVEVGTPTNNDEGTIEFEVISADETPSGAAPTNKLEFHIENDFKITLRPIVDDEPVNIETMLGLEIFCISNSRKTFTPSHIITEAGIEIEFQKESIDITGDYFITLRYKLQDESYQDGFRHVTHSLNAFTIKALTETLSAAGTEIDVEGAKMYKGDPGSTPEIGANGNWFIDGEDTGKPSLIKKKSITFTLASEWVNIGGLFALDLYHDQNDKMSAEIFLESGERIECDYNNNDLNKVTLYSVVKFNGYILLT